MIKNVESALADATRKLDFFLSSVNDEEDESAHCWWRFDFKNTQINAISAYASDEECHSA